MNSFAKPAILLVICLLCTAELIHSQENAVSEPSPANTKAHASQIESLIKKYQEYNQFNGAVLVAENDEVILRQGFGMANMEWDIPIKPDTKFRIGSVTKQFTAALILQLVEDGKVKLDEPMTTYLADYRKDTGDKVTVHQLLNPHIWNPRATRRHHFSPMTARLLTKSMNLSRNFAVAISNSNPGPR